MKKRSGRASGKSAWGHFGRRVLCAVIVFALCLKGGVKETAIYADPAPLSYIDENGVTGSCDNYTEVSASSGDVTWSAGWYAVTSDVTIEGRVTVSGSVQLILCDGKKLIAKQGITVQDDDGDVNTPSPNAFMVYGQSTGENAGKLFAGTTNGDDQTCLNNCAGIGGGTGGSGGEITISGGEIIARGSVYGAGIGGGKEGSGGKITVNDGKISINKTVNASWQQANVYVRGAGIGGGQSGSGGEITINGGEISINNASTASEQQAHTYVNGAGIGGGNSGSGGEITINGGEISINNASTASGQQAYTYDHGAGIGGGQSGSGGEIAINGGKISIENTMSASGSQASVSSEGACIGGGSEGSGGNIVIIGGEIKIKTMATASTFMESADVYGACIGGGKNKEQEGNLNLSEMMVFSGDSEPGSKVVSGERSACCRSNGNHYYLKVEACDHEDYEENICKYCGKTRSVSPVRPDIPYIPPFTGGEEQETGDDPFSGDFFKELADISEGGAVTIDMKGSTMLPGQVAEAIKGKNIELVLDMGDGIKLTINGRDVTGTSHDIDMTVSMNTSLIPIEVLKRVTNERYATQISLGKGGLSGLKAVLTLPMRKQDKGLFANLFRYLGGAAKTALSSETTSPDMDGFEFISSGRIADDGSVDLVIDGTKTGSDDGERASFAVVVDDRSLDPAEVPEPEPEPESEEAVLELKAVFKNGKIVLSWNGIEGAEQYRIVQKVGGKTKIIKTTEKRKCSLTKAFTVDKKSGEIVKKMLVGGKKYTFAVRAYVNGKWTKITDASKKTVKVKKP